MQAYRTTNPSVHRKILVFLDFGWTSLFPISLTMPSEAWPLSEVVIAGDLASVIRVLCFESIDASACLPSRI